MQSHDDVVLLVCVCVLFSTESHVSVNTLTDRESEDSFLLRMLVERRGG